jgi:hypothetical protein
MQIEFHCVPVGLLFQYKPQLLYPSLEGTAVSQEPSRRMTSLWAERLLEESAESLAEQQPSAMYFLGGTNNSSRMSREESEWLCSGIVQNCPLHALSFWSFPYASRQATWLKCNNEANCRNT